jgi:hypothetical protein
MHTIKRQSAHSALISLEVAATSAREGFGCMFSSSEEYESALISERRAQGRYGKSRNRWPLLMFFSLALFVVGTVFILH